MLGEGSKQKYIILVELGTAPFADMTKVAQARRKEIDHFVEHILGEKKMLANWKTP